MTFRQYRRTSSGVDAGVHALLNWLTIVTAPIWVPVLLVVLIYQECSSNTPAARAERARIQAQEAASKAQEQNRAQQFAFAAAHERWDDLRCEALFVRLDRAVRGAHQGGDADALEAATLREQADNHGCKQTAAVTQHARRRESSSVSRQSTATLEQQALWRTRANWRKLRKSMTEAQVRAILGEPSHIEAGYITYWAYGGSNWLLNPHVEFVGGSVTGWQEP
jgi:hypothetical protein